jgi:hypothetical protein
VFALGEPGEAAIGAVPNDRPEARQRIDPLVQELAGGHHIVRVEQAEAATGNPRISDEQRALGADGPAAASAGRMEGGARATALHGLGVDPHHRR